MGPRHYLRFALYTSTEIKLVAETLVLTPLFLEDYLGKRLNWMIGLYLNDRKFCITHHTLSKERLLSCLCLAKQDLFSPQACRIKHS